MPTTNWTTCWLPMAPKSRIHTNRTPTKKMRKSHQNTLYCQVSIPGGGQNLIRGRHSDASDSASKVKPATIEMVKNRTVIN